MKSMPRQIKYVVAVFAVILVAASMVFFLRGKATAPTDSRSPSADQIELPDAVDIVYTGYSFTPGDIAVASGATVTIINEAPSALQLASDPYPLSDANPEFNVGTIESGKSKSFTITKKGAWGYHNRLAPGHHGRITILR
jgi:hypothetical protein